MNIVVLLKQVPDEKVQQEYQDVDVFNDSDKNVLKEALDLRNLYGGSVTVIGIGPRSAEKILKETLTYGIERAVLVSDLQYEDLDVAGISKIMAQAVNSLGTFDIVLCGRQAIDGDSAHMAAMTAGALHVPLVPYSKEIVLEGEKIQAICESDQEDHRVEAKIPAMVLSIREKNQNRFPAVPDIMKTYNGTYQTEIFDNSRLHAVLEKKKIRRLRRYEEKTAKKQKLLMLTGKDDAESAENLEQFLRDQHVL